MTTDAQASWWGGRGVGTVPHALISAYGGNTVLAATKFAEWAARESPDINVTVLVDFENDSVETALEVARALGDRLWGVRLDTSETLVDRSLWEEMGDFRPTRGERAPRAEGARTRSTRPGSSAIKIVASGGFDAEKIRTSRSAGVPVDSYGVGSALIRGRTTSPATSSSRTASRPRRSGAATGRTSVSSCRAFKVFAASRR